MECIVEVLVESVLVTGAVGQWRVGPAGVRDAYSFDIKSRCWLAPWGGLVAEKGGERCLQRVEETANTGVLKVVK
jgi:hypothetical protein